MVTLVMVVCNEFQSLLATALTYLHLGRGTLRFYFLGAYLLTSPSADWRRPPQLV